jgi:hypothetical protein
MRPRKPLVEFGNVGLHCFNPAHLHAEQEAVALYSALT